MSLRCLKSLHRFCCKTAFFHTVLFSAFLPKWQCFEMQFLRYLILVTTPPSSLFWISKASGWCFWGFPHGNISPLSIYCSCGYRGTYISHGADPLCIYFGGFPSDSQIHIDPRRIVTMGVTGDSPLFVLFFYSVGTLYCYCQGGKSLSSRALTKTCQDRSCSRF